MFTIPQVRISVVPRLVIAVAVGVTLVITAIVSGPALLILPFVPGADARADQIAGRLMDWATLALTIGESRGP
ncbi:hypothetical protein GCM10009557_78370 [Virgisporangium ochraceum]|uniref:Uncharacterized protein n=1 Tax=Virgisporangium ochraceum TaxID=65505 RepID=A0A8J4A2U5_9ACTN|nr:hypothetical protein [Virgisporangium ochraceum]GIJ74822.1 hypothetical protein Voc01_097390 [Virgisporangium ochraceum]